VAGQCDLKMDDLHRAIREFANVDHFVEAYRPVDAWGPGGIVGSRRSASVTGNKSSFSWKHDS